MVDEITDEKFILLVTGLSGAGKTEALQCLEDMGYRSIDNLPLHLVSNLLSDVEALPDKLVLAADSRNTDITTHYQDAIESLRNTDGVKSHVIYLHADEGELVRRFKETRRKHPWSPERALSESISLEKQVMTDLRSLSDSEIDTTTFKARDLWRHMKERYQPDALSSLQVFVMSFGFKHGLPAEVDMVFDVRFLKNPHWVPDLKPKTGMDKEIQNYVMSDPEYNEAFGHISTLVNHAAQQFAKSDRAYLTIGIGCTGGQHRSVTVAEKLTASLKSSGLSVGMHHRDARLGRNS